MGAYPGLYHNYNIVFICNSRLRDLAISTLYGQQQDEIKTYKFTSISSLPCGCEVNKPTGGSKQTGKFVLRLYV